MTDPIIGYLESCKEGLGEYFAEVVRTSPELFPSYTKFDLATLQRLLNNGVARHLRAVESGDFEEVKEALHHIFSERLQSGFHPNEMIRMIELTTRIVTEAIRHAPGREATAETLYCQRSESIAQVAKMYIAILNLSIPKEERSEIESILLAL